MKRFLVAAVAFLALVAPGRGERRDQEDRRDAPRAAVAAGVTFAVPQAGGVLHAGETVEIRWSGVPAKAEEIELLLSVDGGRTWALRLTEELTASTGSFIWQVPNLATRHAALALRMGIDEVETTSGPGPEFRIEPDRGLSPAALEWRGEEIWLSGGEAFSANDDSLPPMRDLARGSGRMDRLPEDGEDVLLPRVWRAPGLDAGAPATAAFQLSAAPRAVRVTSRVPSTFPQRI